MTPGGIIERRLIREWGLIELLRYSQMPNKRGILINRESENFGNLINGRGSK